jgi:hypothetical protein
MALTTTELEFLSAEVRRVLKPSGLNIYTLRHTNDPDYRTGIHRGEDMYEVGGFIVHFLAGKKWRVWREAMRLSTSMNSKKAGCPESSFA